MGLPAQKPKIPDARVTPSSCPMSPKLMLPTMAPTDGFRLITGYAGG
eukprot:CAMPEP_0185191036 /NCGR_PEP_ID=MMETSP1140-20130426/13353_1 /TAXON_ID=298111 /ORGANISM="Pavlova sp., Strain CCMP459" /LENGTH=46 /DNA_ID= /DNA_START= /DNA_END= /DNA_ORIENTATION=